MGTCTTINDPDSAWPALCPNQGAAGFFLFLFAATMCVHTAQAVLHRKVYSIVVIMSAVWQTLAYTFRILSIQHYKNSGFYSAWFILILLAPLWTNAYCFMVLGRIVYNFTSSAKIFGLHAWRFGLYFVLLDIVAFIVQATGASMAAGDDLTHDQIMRGLHVYMVGMGIQLFFIIVFFGFAIRACQIINRDSGPAERIRAKTLMYTLFVVLTLIIIRIIFRLIEYSNGYETGIPVHEAYQYSLDSLPMWVALVLLNIVHPGRIMPGKESDLPSRKVRKAAGKGNILGRAPGDGGKGSNGIGLPTYQSAVSPGNGYANASANGYVGEQQEVKGYDVGAAARVV